ncbi:serine hydrolase [Tundrisphaera sp. TA3]|uniref:serine hydrolase n=1 Tax=Tundrisphaera sp. TA3 TaxID=3435775 RepID=UPI003EB9125D
MQLGILIAFAALTSPPSTDALKARVEAIIRDSGAEAVAVAYDDPSTGASLRILPDETFHAASTMKLGVLMQTYRLAHEGKLKLDDRLKIGNEFRSIVDGSTYSLARDDDSEFTLYDRIGQEETIAELARLMIVSSSNLATNLLIDRVGAEATNAFMADLGATGLVIRRGVQDDPAFKQGLNNTTTAPALLRLLTLLAGRKAVSPESSDAMVAVLKGQNFRNGLPAGLPAGTEVAHKTGSITRINHDAGIIYPAGRPPYALAILTRGLDEADHAKALIAAISAAVYAHATGDDAAAAPAESPAPRAFIDGTGPGWRTLGEADFAPVNGDPSTWTWKDDGVTCSGLPVGVTRTRKPLTNFELSARWRHLKPGGNSGFFAWASDEALAGIKPGTLPRGGIEIQILDHGYREQYEKQTGKKGDWFSTDGDIFPVGTSKMTPFPPTSPNGERSFPRKKLSKGVGEWNHYYVRAINGEVRLWVNGEEVSGGTGCEPRTGYLCLESEGSPIEFKQIRIRELP